MVLQINTTKGMTRIGLHTGESLTGHLSHTHRTPLIFQPIHSPINVAVTPIPLLAQTRPHLPRQTESWGKCGRVDGPGGIGGLRSSLTLFMKDLIKGVGIWPLYHVSSGLVRWEEVKKTVREWKKLCKRESEKQKTKQKRVWRRVSKDERRMGKDGEWKEVGGRN